MAHLARNDNTTRLEIEKLAFQNTSNEYTQAQLKEALAKQDDLAVTELIG